MKSNCYPSTCDKKENCDMSKCNGKCGMENCKEGMKCHGEGMCQGEMKCDMSKCATMTKEECAKMCDEKGCSPEEKAICMAHYGKDGKWIGGTGNECTKKKECCKGH
jgi:K(+)-stimulated pyrophosphate-energized sodium pump